MAPSRLLLCSSLALLLLIFNAMSSASASASAAASTLRSSERLGGDEGKLGGRTEIEDVGTNKEVQRLGRFCVQEHNRRSGHGSTEGGAALLSFSRVVDAQQQVVAGVKYYLRIAAREGHGGKMKTFDAVVVVRPWLKSKELLSFNPSTN